MMHAGFPLLTVLSVRALLGPAADSSALVGLVIALAAMIVLSSSMSRSAEDDFALTPAVMAVGSIAVLAVAVLGLLP